VHQIEAAHVGIHDRCALNGARVVDHDIEPAEGRDGLLDRVFHLRLVAHIDHQGQRVAAGFGDLVGGGEYGARQLGCGLSVLAAMHVGAVERSAERNCKPDAARCAGDEDVWSLRTWFRLVCDPDRGLDAFPIPYLEGGLPRATVGQNL